MGKIRTWLKGYIQLYLYGNRPERFLSLMNHKEIYIWDVKPFEDGYLFNMEQFRFRELDGIRKKTGCKLEIRQKYGLPFWLFRYRKRKLFVLGLLAGCGLVYWGSGFIWDINVQGTYFYTDEQVTNYIEQEAVKLGSRSRDVDCEQLEEQLREVFPEIAWVSCEIKGTQLNVEIKETLEGTEGIRTEKKPQDVVAAKDGVIVEMITRSGTPLVKTGETVSKGDVLISGIVHIYDDYDEILETDTVAADGDVIAETVYAYQDAFDMQYYDKDYTGEQHRSITLEIGSFIHEYKLFSVHFQYYDQMEENHKLKLGHTYFLPCSFTINTYLEYAPTLHTYTEEEAKNHAEERFQRYLDNLSEKEVEIMENNVTIDFKENTCQASGTVTVWERIGYGKPLPEQEVPVQMEEKE